MFLGGLHGACVRQKLLRRHLLLERVWSTKSQEGLVAGVEDLSDTEVEQLKAG